MKKAMVMIIAGSFAAITAMAQVAQFSASASYLKGVDDNKASLWGGGLSGKGYIGQHFALGAAIHSYPKKTASATVNGFNYTRADWLTNVVATTDFLLTPKTSAIQPYLGVDLGASFNNHTVSYTNTETQTIQNSNKKTYFLLAPKAGINIGLGQAFGLFGQVQYNITYGEGRSVAIDDVPNPFTDKAVSKFLNFDAGVYFRLMPAK